MLEGPTGLLDTQKENRGGYWENVTIIIKIYSPMYARKENSGGYW